MSEQNPILVKCQEGILELSINRIERKNALNQSMYQHLLDQIQWADTNPQVRVVVIYGLGGCFTSGNDLADFGDFAEPTASSPSIQFLQAFCTFNKPVIAAVDGIAYGIGTTLLLHCDFVFASGRSEFKLPFAQLGLCPEFGSSYLLPKLVGYLKAAEWLLLGEKFTAQQAFDAGLITRLDDDPLTTALATALKLSKMPFHGLMRTKALLKRFSMTETRTAMEAELSEFAQALKGAEFAEATAAFFAKRPADFSKLNEL
jgi:enoyl-CoA hydratase/carnithine racemase